MLEALIEVDEMVESLENTNSAQTKNQKHVISFKWTITSTLKREKNLCHHREEMVRSVVLTQKLGPNRLNAKMMPMWDISCDVCLWSTRIQKLTTTCVQTGLGLFWSWRWCKRLSCSWVAHNNDGLTEQWWISASCMRFVIQHVSMYHSNCAWCNWWKGGSKNKTDFPGRLIIQMKQQGKNFTLLSFRHLQI